MRKTPEKFSSPPPQQIKFANLECESIGTNTKLQQNCSVLEMINKECLSSPRKKGPLYDKGSFPQRGSCSRLEDRFIPSRKLTEEFELNQAHISNQNKFQEDPQPLTVAQIFQEQILGKSAKRLSNQSQNDIQSFKNKNILKYSTEHRKRENGGLNSAINSISSCYIRGRKISKNPCKILDAPALVDDFYLNLVDWSHDNVLAVGLANSIYLWSAQTSKVAKLCEIPADTITSVCWSGIGSLLSIGCSKGQVLIWDVKQQKQIRRLEGHQVRVGSIAWSSKLLSTGSRDKAILQRDIRSPKSFVQKLTAHDQQICGLKWSKDDQYLASGGNDNKAIVWNLGGQIINKFLDHKAAVKALAWSPHHHGLLATGGGTSDRMLKMRNALTGQFLCSKDTGSQICNVQFSKSLHEVVSTHGYSQNEVNIWSYPSMRKISCLKGHTQRIIYLSMSPDGSTIVTGAGDETLRFWNVFPSCSSKIKIEESLLEHGMAFR